MSSHEYNFLLWINKVLLDLTWLDLMSSWRHCSVPSLCWVSVEFQGLIQLQFKVIVQRRVGRKKKKKKKKKNYLKNRTITRDVYAAARTPDNQISLGQFIISVWFKTMHQFFNLAISHNTVGSWSNDVLAWKYLRCKI